MEEHHLVNKIIIIHKFEAMVDQDKNHRVVINSYQIQVIVMVLEEALDLLSKAHFIQEVQRGAYTNLVAFIQETVVILV